MSKIHYNRNIMSVIDYNEHMSEMEELKIDGNENHHKNTFLRFNGITMPSIPNQIDFPDEHPYPEVFAFIWKDKKFSSGRLDVVDVGGIKLVRNPLDLNNVLKLDFIDDGSILHDCIVVGDGDDMAILAKSTFTLMRFIVLSSYGEKEIKTMFGLSDASPEVKKVAIELGELMTKIFKYKQHRFEPFTNDKDYASGQDIQIDLWGVNTKPINFYGQIQLIHKVDGEVVGVMITDEKTGDRIFYNSFEIKSMVFGSLWLFGPSGFFSRDEKDGGWDDGNSYRRPYLLMWIYLSLSNNKPRNLIYKTEHDDVELRKLIRLSGCTLVGDKEHFELHDGQWVTIETDCHVDTNSYLYTERKLRLLELALLVYSLPRTVRGTYLDELIYRNDTLYVDFEKEFSKHPKDYQKHNFIRLIFEHFDAEIDGHMMGVKKDGKPIHSSELTGLNSEIKKCHDLVFAVE